MKLKGKESAFLAQCSNLNVAHGDVGGKTKMLGNKISQNIRV